MSAVETAAASAAASCAAFAGAACDELFLLVVFFARARRESGASGGEAGGATASGLSACDVAVGYLAGSAAVLAAAAAGAGAGALLPARAVRLLGLLPLCMGAAVLVRRARRRCCRAPRVAPAPLPGAGASESLLAGEAEAAPPEAAEDDGLPSVPSVGIGPAVVSPPPPPVATPPPAHCARAERPAPCVDRWRGWASLALRPGAAEVAAVTLAAGAEEVAAFAPLFATRSPARLAATAVTLPAMVLLWLALAAAFVRCAPFARAFERYGEAAEPFLLVAVGVWCLLGSYLIPIDLPFVDE